MFYIVVETRKHADLVRITDPELEIVVADGASSAISLASSLSIAKPNSRALALIDAHTTHEPSIQSRLSDLKALMHGDSGVILAAPNLFEDESVITKSREWFGINVEA